VAAFAICIGISDYGNATPVPGAERDAMDVARRVRARGFETTLLVGEHATSERFQEALGRIERQAAPDQLLIYHSGHGGRDAHRLTSDGHYSHYLMLRRGSLTEFALHDLLRRWAGRDVFLVFDACFANGMLQGLGRVWTPELSPSGSVLALVAARSDAWAEGTVDGGYLTRAFVAGLDAAVAPVRGRLLFGQACHLATDFGARPQYVEFSKADGDADPVFGGSSVD
jgi:hypothetical protein